jgi:Leucine-rich repeat (LRR) protein
MVWGSLQFRGTVPESYSSLANLRFLNISDNMIFGKLPGFLRDNKQLETVDLHSNLFWGDLPEVSAPVVPSGSLLKFPLLSLFMCHQS